jgi:hypothetical protein
MSDQTEHLAWRETQPVPPGFIGGSGSPVVNYYLGQLIAIHAVAVDNARPAEVAICGMTVHGRINGPFSQTNVVGRCGECAEVITARSDSQGS